MASACLQYRCVAGGVSVDDGAVADVLGAAHEVERGERLVEAARAGAHVGDDHGLGVAAQRVLRRGGRSIMRALARGVSAGSAAAIRGAVLPRVGGRNAGRKALAVEAWVHSTLDRIVPKSPMRTVGRPALMLVAASASCRSWIHFNPDGLRFSCFQLAAMCCIFIPHELFLRRPGLGATHLQQEGEPRVAVGHVAPLGAPALRLHQLHDHAA
jgi:hypothetical protein